MILSLNWIGHNTNKALKLKTKKVLIMSICFP